MYGDLSTCEAQGCNVVIDGDSHFYTDTDGAVLCASCAEHHTKAVYLVLPE